MRVNGKLVGSLEAVDIQRLLDNKTPESRTIEYKRDLPGGNDDSKKEFLADVSAMANASGGTIFYGIDEERDQSGQATGVPASPPVGIQISNEDQLKRELLARIQDGLNPRLTNVIPQVVNTAGCSVLVLGIPRSMYAPHAVWYQKSGRFFRRNESGKYQVDPRELRAMYLETFEWENEAATFHRDRMEKALAGDVLSNLSRDRACVLHTLPFGRLRERVDIFAPARDNPLKYAGYAVNAANWRSNFDGFLLFNVLNTQPSTAYTQVLGCGGFEDYNTRMFRVHGNSWTVTIQGVEDFIKENVKRAVRMMLQEWDITPPYSVKLSIAGAKEVPGLIFNTGFSDISEGRITTNRLEFPSLVLSDSDVTSPDALKPLIDQVWQTFGVLRI